MSDTSYFANTGNSGSNSLSRTSSTTTTMSSSTYSFTAPDGGWGWVIVIASFLVNMIADGITFSFGVLFIELQKEFAESKAVTAAVVSLFHSVPLLVGPIASALTDRYGCRKMTILGSLLATVGFLLSSFCYRLELLYLTFGLMSGFGLSLCYVAAIVIVAYYFDRRRSFATGISVCGSGVGTFVFAPIIHYLIEEYGGWRGATVVLAGFLLNMCVCGALFRDLEYPRKIRRHRKSSGSQKRGSFGSASSHSHSTAAMPDLEELKAILETGDVTALFSQEDLEECPRLSASLIDLPTYVSNGEKLPDDVVNALSKNKQACRILLQNYPSLNIFGGRKNNHGGNDRESSNDAGESSEPAGTKLKRKVSSLFKKRPNRSILKRPVTSGEEANTTTTTGNAEEEEAFIAAPSRAATIIPSPNPVPSLSKDHPKSINLHHLRVRRQSLTYRSAMLNINRYRLRASSCPDIYRNSMTTIAQEEEEELCCSCLNGMKDFLFDCCQWNFFNTRFVIFCLSNFILYAWYDVMYMYLVDYGELELHFPSTDATFLISVIGILNTIGEVFIGWAGDQEWMNLNLLYAVCMLACGLSTAVVPFLTKYAHMAAMAGIFGFAISANYALTSPILVELVALEHFSNAYGLLLLAQGISNLVGPPFAGALYDMTKQWYLTFGLAGVFIAISGFLLLILPCCKKAKSIRRRHLSQSSDVESAAYGEGLNKTSESIVIVTGGGDGDN